MPPIKKFTFHYFIADLDDVEFPCLVHIKTDGYTFEFAGFDSLKSHKDRHDQIVDYFKSEENKTVAVEYFTKFMYEK